MAIDTPGGTGPVWHVRVSPGLLIARGIFSILFGILALWWPGATLLTIAILYGAYALADGILAITGGVRSGIHHKPWGWAIIEGILGVGAGVVTFLWPGITIFVLSVLVGAWALVTGLVELTAAFRLSRVFPAAAPLSKILLGLTGVLSIALGVVILVWPALGAATLITLVAVYAIFFGALYTGLGIQLRRHPERFPAIETGSHKAA